MIESYFKSYSNLCRGTSILSPKGYNGTAWLSSQKLAPLRIPVDHGHESCSGMIGTCQL